MSEKDAITESPITDFKEAIKDRLKGISGIFIIIFLAYNWKFTLGIFVSKEQIQSEGYNTIFLLVYKYQKQLLLLLQVLH